MKKKHILTAVQRVLKMCFSTTFGTKIQKSARSNNAPCRFYFLMTASAWVQRHLFWRRTLHLSLHHIIFRARHLALKGFRACLSRLLDAPDVVLDRTLRSADT